MSLTSGAGIVHLVGAGPGAADLLTVRAVRVLAAAEVVLHDALVEPEVLALAPQARRIAVGKRAGAHSTDQAVICRLLVREAHRGLKVVRLKGGDPMLFGRASEELAALTAAGVHVEIVPGVTSASVAAAEMGASLTERKVARSVVFVTPALAAGETGDDRWLAAACGADSAAIYMAAGRAREIAQALIDAGQADDTPIVLAANAGRPSARRWRATLAEAARGDLDGLACGAPGLLLVGRAFRAAAAETIAPALSPLRAAQ